MKQKIIILVSIIAIAALSCIGCLILSPVSPLYYARPRQIENADVLYQNAIYQFNATEDYVLTISHTQEMLIGDSTFLEVTDKTVQYDFQSTGKTSIYLQETLYSGTHTVETSELINGETIYLTVNGVSFFSNCDPEQYKQGLIPAIIIDPNLYNSVAGVDNGSSYILTFSEPTGTEKWLTTDAVTLIDATGTATVNYDGQLQNSTYTVTYQKNGIQLRITVQVGIEQKDIEIALPQDTTVYAPISGWESLKMLERACGYLVQAERISSNYNDSIYFQAFGDRREKNILLHAYKENDWAVSVATNTVLKNDTKQDQAVTDAKHELFIENTYSVSNNEGPWAANANITVDAMHNYFQDLLVSTIMLPQYIATADISQIDNILRIGFTGNDDFGLFLAQNACHVLYQDSNLITDSESKFTTTELVCYLDFDRNTGLPVASGINFIGNYKTEGLPYQLEYTANQTYTLPSETAETEIAKAAG